MRPISEAAGFGRNHQPGSVRCRPDRDTGWLRPVHNYQTANLPSHLSCRREKGGWNSGM